MNLEEVTALTKQISRESKGQRASLREIRKALDDIEAMLASLDEIYSLLKKQLNSMN